jgi:uncharacterized protein YutE (UPF0331/DUF86 family)
MVDRDLLLRRLTMLDGYLEQLGPYRGIDSETYRQDWKTQRIVERTLHLAIETCMDVADHIVADRRLRVPETGAESFEILAEANILVHDYTRLDPAIVMRVLQTDLNDLSRFREAVQAIV